MENKDIIIIALVVLVIYLYYQQNQPNIKGNNQAIKDLKQQLQHYQSLYQKRVSQDLDAQTLNSEWETRYNQLEDLNNQTNREKNELTKYQVLMEKKVEDLEKQLLNLAKQKIKGKKEAEKLLTDLETNWQQKVQIWETKYLLADGTLTSQRKLVITQDEKIRSLEHKLAQQEEANQKQRKLIVDLSKKKPTQDLEQTIKELKQERQEQLRKINMLFDENSANYETIDFEGLYKLLASIAERERERERETIMPPQPYRKMRKKKKK